MLQYMYYWSQTTSYFDDVKQYLAQNYGHDIYKYFKYSIQTIIFKATWH